MEKNNLSKRRSTFAILFYINRTKIRKNGTCQLLCKVSIDAEAEQIGTKVSVNPTFWNPDTGRADGSSRNAMVVNQAIDTLTKKIEAEYERIKKNLGFVRAELVKNAVMGIGQKPLTLLALFREHNEEFKKRVGVDRKIETYDSYVRSYNHLRKFVQEKCRKADVALRSLDTDFYDAFDLFLRTDQNLQQKSVHEHLYRLKKMTVRAVNQGTLRRDPYHDLHPELPKRKSRHLKLHELKRLLAEQVADPELQRVRDWFIFSTFTGLAFADLKRLSAEHLSKDKEGVWWIHKDRQKNSIGSVVRLLDIPMRILAKYETERTDERLLPICSYSKVQRLTSRLGAIYGIDKLTFHRARHNFGTHITLSMGVPLETVSRMMGHKRLTTTQIYAHVTDKKVDEDTKQLRKLTASQQLELYEEPLNASNL